VARNRDADVATLTAIHGAATEGKHIEAARLAAAALADGLEHPLVYNLVALAIERQRRIFEAHDPLQRAVQVAPKDIPARNAFGLCLIRLGRPGEALAQFDALLLLDPSLPFAHASQGNALYALGLGAEAEASYRRALQLDAGQVVALVGLARLSNTRAAYAETRIWAQKALEVFPGFPDAVMTLAAAELASGDIAAAESRLRALLDTTPLESGRIAPVDHAYAQGLLGDVLDAKNYTRDAFAAFTACNQELQRIYAGHYTNSIDTLEYVSSVSRYFERAPAGLWTARTAPDARRTGAVGHVFIIGFFRSGASLLQVILQGHPGVVSLEGNEMLADGVQEFMQRPEDLERFGLAPRETVERLRTAYWQRIADSGVDVRGKIFVDTNPLNTLRLPLIGRLFPDAKIIFACRDPRDVVLSCFRHRFRMNAAIHELLSIEGTTRYYDAVMRLTVSLMSLLSVEPCLVRHEDVITDFAREMKRICEFLEIEWNPAMGDFALRGGGDTYSPGVGQLAAGMRKEGIGQWRRYQWSLAPMAQVLDPWVKRFYYDP
jgi:tetratricopeptide (TPR) repeat protein